MRRLLEWFRKYRVMRLAPPEMEREAFYDAMRSPRADVLLAALEQHLKTNGSMDLRAGSIQKAEGPKGYWYLLGYCKAHNDLSAFLKRARRPQEGATVVQESTMASHTGGKARWA